MSYMEQQAQQQIEAGIVAKEQQDQDRILLAEAMGYNRIEMDGHTGWLPPGCKGPLPDSWDQRDFLTAAALPDPLTDANDDYAVLEWARNSWLTRNPPLPDQPEWDQFCDALWETPTLYGSLLFYRIGDYAKAAISVLQRQKQ